MGGRGRRPSRGPDFPPAEAAPRPMTKMMAQLRTPVRDARSPTQRSCPPEMSITACSRHAARKKNTLLDSSPQRKNVWAPSHRERVRERRRPQHDLQQRCRGALLVRCTPSHRVAEVNEMFFVLSSVGGSPAMPTQEPPPTTYRR